MKKTNILLTGITGILGRHIFYELLHEYANNKKKGTLIVVIRPKAGQTVYERLRSIVRHRFRPAYLNNYTENELLQYVISIESDIEALDNTHFTTLESYDNIYVIHAAAETDLSNTSTAHEKIFVNNYLASKHLLEWCSPNLYKFIFISTTFSIGHYDPVVYDQYISFDANNHPVLKPILSHRIPYEEFKIKMEQELIQYCQQQEKKWQIIRPSTICGRMLDEPLYYTPEFNVFYLLGKFLLACSSTDIIHRGETFRIESNPTGTMNIVPVDYVAKTIIRAFENDAIDQLNAVSQRQVSVAYLLQSICSYTGVKCELTEHPPLWETMTEAEKQYYEVMAPILSYYLTLPVHQFDTSTLKKIMTDIPDIDVEKGLKDLYAFAYENEFRSL